MLDNYNIILFKNKVRYKIIKKYKNYKNAEKFYTKLISDNKDIFFEIKTENGSNIDFEVALLEKFSKNILPLFKTDPLGRNIPIKSDVNDLTIIKLDNFKLPEKIFHINSKTKIDFNNFSSKFLKGDELKMISKLNNKIVVQEQDKYNLFSLKTSNDADRFINEIQLFLVSKNKSNCLLIKDTDKTQKKYLYDILSQIGYDKKMLYRKATTHSKDK